MTEIPKASRKPGAGGSEGGTGLFLLGFALAAVALYFFFDSVKATTGGGGLISGAFRGRGGGGGMMETTSMGIIFVPFFIGVVMLFYDSKLKAGWGLTYVGLAIIVVEILSRLRFLFTTKTTHLIIMIVMFAAGTGLMLRSYKDFAMPEDDSGGDG